MKLHFLLFINVFYVPDGNTQRRISSGTEVTDKLNKKYVVYLVKSPASSKIYNEWLCGGALVSTLFILTSAACVEDVEFMYAIAGYKKYVRNEYIEKDPCTKEKKKKVVEICVPVKYDFSYADITKWSYVDIALAKVESAYDLADKSFETLCSYIPTVISIGYEERFSQAGVDAMTFGWGHASIWRMRHDPRNYNLETLMYASVAIVDKQLCKKAYERHDMNTVIDRYMICSLDRGMLDANGNMTYGPYHERPVKISTCGQPVNGNMTDILLDKENPLVVDKTRRQDCILRSNPVPMPEPNMTYGICQNDHGGPLVTWVGVHEVVIGVASVYKVAPNSTCMGPYLYTSTHCTGSFIDCVLSNNTATATNNTATATNSSRRSICDGTPIQRGYDIAERHISWSKHPDGSAGNSASDDAVKKIKTKAKVKYYEQFGIPAKFWDRLKT